MIVQPTYASIECVRNLVEPWIDLLGGDEWGESMRALHQACQTDYGFSDKDCALFATRLIVNLEVMKPCGDIEDGVKLGRYTTRDIEATQQRCVEVRDYWLKGGNLGNFSDTIKVATETLEKIPKWMFGDES